MDPSIIKKLLFSAQKTSMIINSPDDFQKSFAKLAGTSSISSSFVKNPGWALIFVSGKSDVDKLAAKVLEISDPDTILWFAYPKKSSPVKTDLTRDIGWEAVHNRGWSGVSMISIDDTWSAFRVKPRNTGPMNPTSDASVKAATGKKWNGWYRQLDNEGSKSRSHKEIAASLSKNHKLDAWWSQMVTNAYEQHIGRRAKHQMSDGYQASVSKTFPIPVSMAYKAFVNEKLRRKWMKDPEFEISTARENKSLRALWVDGKTRISVDFYAKGDEKCQVVVQHLKLSDSGKCEKMKVYWKENLSKLVQE